MISLGIMIRVRQIPGSYRRSGRPCPACSSRRVIIKDIKFVASSLISAVTLGVSVIVVAVPEGLPMMITVVLSSNLKKMFRSGVLVRKMVGIETAGSMNILFTDKTGTLTTGNMSVNRVYTKDCVFKSSSELLSNQCYKILIPLMSDQ